MYLILILLVLAAVVSSAPTKRQGEPGIWACSDVDWAGNCRKLVAPYGNEYCNTLGDLDEVVSSVGPDQGISCNFYDNGACLDMGIPGADMIELTWPGVANLVEMGWNDKILAYNCVPQAMSVPNNETNATTTTKEAAT
ncbi:hypothetical protein K490DRAFT_62909 [Saccharata proteae CBS 121410]|uniref:Uncharacterized protein n=1 Tax=Saccharata proteae CBS 121410 TaxID=1314787 RepID=A0A9P4HVR9_9PEZI|nr:hypothetical protein K490DRAFT_62909 [Saccharata proteae CBS 121410]